MNGYILFIFFSTIYLIKLYCIHCEKTKIIKHKIHHNIQNIYIKYKCHTTRMKMYQNARENQL